MAKCKWCEQGGLLRRVDAQGLCKDCAPDVAADIESHTNVIYEAMHVFERAQDPDDKRKECDRVIAAAEHLRRYEDKGLQTCSPPAGLVADEYRGFRADLG